MRGTLALVFLLGACAASGPPGSRMEVERQESLGDLQEELARNERALLQPKAEEAPVDCDRATKLGNNVCVLAERICALVDRLPPEPANTAQCTDARARCKRARERVAAVCKS